MDGVKSENKGFSRPRCCECGAELTRQLTAYEAYESRRLYCDSCKQIETIKQSWQPLGSGRVDRVFVIREK